jgi:glycosyltransferase involved in cell wall biosynthesis
MNKISIALCTYNGSEFLEQQLNSFIHQDRQPDEVIICDDRSSDRTHEIVNDFIKRAPFKVGFVINSNNLGITKNFEKAVRLCTGDLIALSDQDDIWHPQKIRMHEKIFNNRSDIGATFSNAEVVDEILNPIGYDMWHRVNFTHNEQQKLLNGEAVSVLLKHYIITGATMVFRADLKPIILPIPSCWFHDAWLALMTASISNVSFISEPLIKYRQHSDNQLGGIHKGLAKQIIEAFKTNRNDYYKIELLKYSLALDRLRNISDYYNVSENIYLLNEKIKHLQIRASMGRNRFFRIPCILKEIIQLGYYRYSRNWGSIAMDLLFK